MTQQNVSWENSFIAVSIALGGSVDDAAAVLVDPKPAKELLAALGANNDRKTRAKALATALAPVVMDLERAEVTWG